MEVRSGRIAGHAARLLLVGYVGERGYEIHVPMADGEALWNTLMAAGRAAGNGAQRAHGLIAGFLTQSVV